MINWPFLFARVFPYCWRQMRESWIINASGGRLLTKNLFTKAQWEAKDLSNMVCAYWDDKLYTFFKGSGTAGFYIDMDDMRVIDFSIDDKRFYDAKVFGSYLYVLIENQTTNNYEVYTWEQASTELTYTWKCKKFQFFSPFNFTVGRVVADGSVTVKLYVDEFVSLYSRLPSICIFQYCSPT